MTVHFTPHYHRLDVIPSGPDVRDYIWHPPAGAIVLPASFDLEAQGFCPPIDDQGQEGSCVGHAVAGDDEITQRVDTVQEFKPSRSFAYWAARMADSGVAVQDVGASIRGGVAGLARYGVCNEGLMPYVVGGYATQPTGNQIAAAFPNKISAYHSVPQDLTTIKAAIAAKKSVIYGFAVYASFEGVGSDGMIAPPGGTLYGYHANVLVAYDDSINRFKTRNSWGRGWGKAGYGWFSYGDIINPRFAFDLWVVDAVPGVVPVPPPTPPTPPPPAPVAKKVVQVNTYTMTEAVYDDHTTKRVTTPTTGFGV